MKFIKYIVILFFCFFVTSFILHFFSINNLSTISSEVVALHGGGVTHSKPLLYTMLESGDSLITVIDATLPFFPSFVRTVWWTPQVIVFFSLIPFLIIFAFVIYRRPKVGLLFFALFLLLLIPLKKLVIQTVDSYVITHKFDIVLPWSRKYVWMNDGDDSKNSYVQYRYTWEQKNKEEEAKILISCLGHYRLSVNDKRIYHGPVFGVAPIVYADTLNIASYLKAGSNTIDIICIHVVGITHEYSSYPQSGLLVGGKVQDGLFAHNLADSRLWKYTVMSTVKPGQRIFDAGYKEDYDLSKKEVFADVPNNVSFNYTIQTRPIPLLKYQEATIKKMRDGVYDLGTFSTGYVKIDSSQQKECTLQIVYGVSLDTTGFPPVYMGQEDSINLPKARVDWEQISRRSGRYIGLKGDCDSEQLKLSFRKVYNDFNLPSKPSSLKQEDSAIYDISLNSLRNNVQDHIEDSVDRERGVYLGDAIPVSRCLLSVPGNGDLVKQTILQFSQSQNKDGSFPSMTPSGLEQFIPAYSLQWPTLLQLYGDQTHDKAFVKEMWPHLERVMKWANTNTSQSGFFTNKSNDLRWWNFFDWTPISTALEYQTQNQLWYLRSLQIAASIADMMGEDATSYQKEEKELRKNLYAQAFDKNSHVFYDSFDGKRKDGVSLVTNALAGSLGLFPTKTANDQALEYFKDDYMTQSPYSESWVVDWMIRSGKRGLALVTLRQYWEGMVKDGATSVYEVYKPGVLIPDQTNQSYSHAWGCGPVYEYQEIYNK